MRTTIDLPDELVRRAKSLAARKGLTLKTLFTRALQKETSELEGTPLPTETRVAFPLIVSRRSEKRAITNEVIEEHLTLDELK
ncbi:hypothetical protein [Pelagicoccus sp. SDUM812002]|uniref:hypothetical protein n=1 Tax=Pelagicoccus sp. SDUM812002 TaxID=3041266 RepID=UPI00280F92FF|nr:hypothetical protein [Pelagicoccus sp. SDUM812002]MDQ8188169.1 hypothetical protein [Pelagicoccus sp. SDUM812002]